MHFSLVKKGVKKEDGTIAKALHERFLHEGVIVRKSFLISHPILQAPTTDKKGGCAMLKNRSLLSLRVQRNLIQPIHYFHQFVTKQGPTLSGL